MRNRIQDVAALFLIIISITGIASANIRIPEDNTDMKVSVITLPADGWADLDIIAAAPGDNAAMPGNMSISVLDDAGNPAKGLQVVIDKKISSKGTDEASLADNPVIRLNYGADGFDTFNLRVRDISGAAKKYIIKIEDPASGAQLAKATVEVKPLSGVSVPEFPTVALPVAVIMGLVFFFNSRKEMN
ncbi:MAG: PEF-CTERM sorting domain-containing protein [Candidatus Methanoperedens sp.]|nr:PEF-CTERM sorting domain-containing protein [Candidatus Methanoperedens sp.]